MIQEQDLDILLKLLQTQQNVKQQNLQKQMQQKENTLSQIIQKFTQTFGNDNVSNYNPCHCLLVMLQDNLLTETSRLLAIFLIIEGYQTQNFYNSPFALFIIEILITSTSNLEQQFIEKCLKNEERAQMMKKTISQIIQKLETSKHGKIDIENYKQIKQQILENFPKLGISECNINNFVCDFNIKEKQITPPKINIEANQIPQEELGYDGFAPDYLRPIAEFIPIEQDEYQWINPGMAPDVLWNYNNNFNQSAIVKELMQKAFTSSLQKEEIKALEEAFKQDPKLIEKSGISPTTLTQLVEKNASIASTILIQLSKTCPEELNSYFEKIVHMELTLYSLEVVNTLVQKETVPQDFLNYYICNCIQQCEELKKDKNTQNRLVRLVCAFIKSLIKNKTINPKDMYIELQAFCIEFSKVTEASQLFKMLKQLNSSGKQPTTNLGGKSLSNGGNK